MSYARALLGRWSRRDRLAVVVVAVSVAFVTGAGLVGYAASAELASVAAEFDSPAAVAGYDSPAAARAAADDGDLVLLLAAATTSDGRSVTVVGLPPETSRVAERTGVELPARPPPGTVRWSHDSSAGERATLAGADGTTSVAVEPRGGPDALPTRWALARPSVVDDLGPTGAIVVSPGEGPTPVRGVLAFFRLGGRSVLRAVWLAAGAAGVLLGVTVLGVTRMTVRDRLRTIAVVRATGAPPRRVLALFGLRAGLQTAVGVALGYALGVVLPNAAVNLAVFLGRPTSLSLRVTEPLVAVLAPTYLALLGVGACGGVLAALPAVRRPPARLASPAERTREPRLPGWLRPSLVGWRALVPTAATLSVFLTVAVLVSSAGALVAPLANTSGTTVTEPGAVHPVASSVPERYAAELRASGTPASAELLVLGAVDGQPYVARGADFAAFANVTDARVARGRAPRRPGEAVVGVDLARTLDLAVGDRLVVGGSTESVVERVTVVGTFSAPEPYDDQLVVPLATARRMTGRAPGTVHFVRTASRPDAGAADGPTVLEVDAPATAEGGETVRATATVVNPTAERRTTSVTASFDGTRRTRSVTLGPGERATVAFAFPAGEPRDATLAVGNRTSTVRVLDPRAPRIVGLPDRAPPGSAPRIRVVRGAGEPVGNASVSVGDATVRTGPDGFARVPLEEPGSVTVRARAGERTATATLEVAPGAARRPRVDLAVTPGSVTPATRPTLEATVANPWNRTVETDVALAGPDRETVRSVELAPGARETVSLALPRRAPGAYGVTVHVGGERAARTTYRVAGDERLAAALATRGAAGPGTGIGRALAVVLGNVELLVATILGLAALTTVGGTTASFASAVHARRRTVGIHRAVGASPRAVLATVLRDGLLVGSAATVLALALSGLTLGALEGADLLTVYGVRLLSGVDPLVVAGVAVVSLGLAAAGASLAAVGSLLAPPGRLLAPGSVSRRRGESGD